MRYACWPIPRASSLISFRLGAWARTELQDRFDTDAERTVRAIRSATNLPSSMAVTPVDRREVVARLR